MSRLDNTLANLAPGVSHSRDLAGFYNPRHGLAIYCLPIPGYTASAPGVVLGEALAARSGLGCTLLEGVPEKVPEGAVVVGQYSALKAVRDDLLEDVPPLQEQGEYVVKLGRSALVTSPSREGLAAGMQTLAMLVLRHNDDLIPAAVIQDAPVCQHRGLAVEVRTGELGVNLLMQMASFAATFKANRLHLILDEDFDPSREIPGIETFTQTCQSYGISLGVRLPWLGRILSGEKTLLAAWSGLRAAARVFGATQVALDDPLPADADAADAARIVKSVVNGDVGLKDISMDAGLLLKAGVPAGDLRAMGVTGWHRLANSEETPGREMADLPLRLDVEAPIPGFTSRAAGAYHRRIDAAMGWLRARQRREILFSFRNIGVSHLWQNMLYPAATGLIAAWGRPDQARQSAWLFSNLLYGDTAAAVMSMWDAASAAFPTGLDAEDETLVRRTAFGNWPETDTEWRRLQAIEWLETTRRIMTAAEALRDTASALTRNSSTLSGGKLALQALSWLHCFVALTPELERRRAAKFDEDGRTEPIATELYNNFQTWQASLQELAAESGLDIAEMPTLESMGLRLKGLCENIFE